MKQRRGLILSGLTVALCLSTIRAAEVKPLEIGAAAPDFSLPGVERFADLFGIPVNPLLSSL